MNLLKHFDNLFTNRKNTVYCIALTSIVVQSLFLFVSTDIAKLAKPFDYINYYKPGAENILSGRGYVDNDSEFITRYPPGYSLYLIFPLSAAKVTGFAETTFVKLFSLITLTLATLFFFLMVESVAGTRLAFISSLIWITYPFHIWLVKNPYSEIPFLLFFFGGLWLFFYSLSKEKPLIILLSGFLLGIAVLIRPIGLMLGILCAFGYLILGSKIWKKKLISASLILIGFLVALIPWEIYAFSKTGEIIPVSKNGPAGIIDGITYALRTGTAGDRVEVPDDVLAFMERTAENKNLTDLGKVVHYLSREFSKNPLTLSKLALLKMGRSLYGTSAMWYENYIILIQLAYFASIISGFIIAFKRHKEIIGIFIFVIIIFGYFWGMSTLAGSILRYMLPGMGLLFVFSAIALDRIMSIVLRSKTAKT